MTNTLLLDTLIEDQQVADLNKIKMLSLINELLEITNTYELSNKTVDLLNELHDLTIDATFYVYSELEDKYIDNKYIGLQGDD